MPYIYKIINNINGKLYIGKTSSSIEERFKGHISDSKKLRPEKRPLYDAMRKYGYENFTIEEIEQVENDEIACKREIYWIDKLRTYIGFRDCNGYNATLGGDSRRLYDYSEIANKYLELRSEKAVTEYFHCDRQTVVNACKENNINIELNIFKQRIKRISKDGEIKIYESITEAAKDFPDKNIQTARKNISRALNKSSIGYGYYWEKI
jgi:group I intron endonuclease